MAITKISDLNYKSTLGRFKSSIKYLEKNWNNSGIINDPILCDEMLFFAARAGNKDVVQFLVEEHNADPNTKRFIQIYTYALSNCIFYGNATKGGDFRDTAIYLMDNGADPSIGDNEPLHAAYESHITLIAGTQLSINHKKLKKHDRVVERILKDQSVIKKILELKQEKFYFLIPEIKDIFLFD